MSDETEVTASIASKSEVKEEMQIDRQDNSFSNEDKAQKIKEEPSESGETTDQSIESKESKGKQTRTENKRKRPAKRCRPKFRTRKPKKQRKLSQTNTSTSTSLVEDETPISLDSKVVKTEPDTKPEDNEYVLTVSNLPNVWSYMDIKNFFDTEIEPVDEMELVKADNTGIGAVRLAYQDEALCKSALEKLQGKVVEGKTLSVEMTVESLDSDTDAKSDTTEDLAIQRPWKPDMDEWEIDPKGLYGLKPEFLKSLNIVPPLDKWVSVSNFRCDKSELRDVMEMAGRVVSCSVFTVMNRYANVMYSHPLEAVQAVSMLNGATYYGQKLKVSMYVSPSETILLPKGLTEIGKGLGIDGKPLRNVVKHYKRMQKNESCLLSPLVAILPNGMDRVVPEVHFNIKPMITTTATTSTDTKPTTTNNTNKTTTQIKPAEKPKSSPNAIPTVSRASIPSKVNNNFRPNAPYQRGPRPMGQGPMGPGPMGPGPMGHGAYGPRPMGPRMMGPHGPGNGWNGPGPMGPRPMGQVPMGSMGPGPMGPRPMGPGPMGPGHMGPGPMVPFNNNEPVQLHLSNLPPSTTFALLCEKMAACGQVVSIQLTTPGCAVVTFANRVQADYCFQNYNGTYVEGHVIAVKYT